MSDRFWKTEKYRIDLEAPSIHELEAKMKKEDSSFLLDLLPSPDLNWYTDGLSEQSPAEAAMAVLFQEGGEVFDATNYVTYEDYLGARIWLKPDHAVLRLYRPYQSEEDWKRFKHEHHIVDLPES